LQQQLGSRRAIEKKTTEMLNTWAKESVCEYGILFFKKAHIKNDNTNQQTNGNY